ncbi:MAG: hypothetical protein JJU29_15190, partial [Verrucomicrobia bacterium]|nr:hypothetical protein [Verrucomicrobiota bacterium]
PHRGKHGGGVTNTAKNDILFIAGTMPPVSVNVSSQKSAVQEAIPIPFKRTPPDKRGRANAR